MTSQTAADLASPRLLPLLLLLLLLTMTSVRCCQHTAVRRAIMGDGHLAAPAFPAASSCACCGACHALAGCASLSFTASAGGGACRLYRAAPSYATLVRQPSSELFVMPGRSGHLQFCRRHADCTEKGDRCFGRICTADCTVSCRDLADSGTVSNGLHYGSIDGRLVKLDCSARFNVPGWTLIGRFKTGASGWNRTNIVERNVDDPSGHYSILRLAETLRRSGGRPRFQIYVKAELATGGSIGFMGSLPTSQTLVSTEDTLGADLRVERAIGEYHSRRSLLRVPWLPQTGAAYLTISKEGISSAR